jgi:hypothetical protein
MIVLFTDNCQLFTENIRTIFNTNKHENVIQEK